MPALPARYLLVLALLLGVATTSPLALSQEQSPDQQRFVVDIELQTREQFDLLLQRANQLLLSGEVQQQGDAAVVGTPFVEGASVKAKILRHGKDDKILVHKYRRRTKYRLTQGHRQDFTEVEISKIVAP